MPGGVTITPSAPRVLDHAEAIDQARCPRRLGGIPQCRHTPHCCTHICKATIPSRVSAPQHPPIPTHDPHLSPIDMQCNSPCLLRVEGVGGKGGIVAMTLVAILKREPVFACPPDPCSISGAEASEAIPPDGQSYRPRRCQCTPQVRRAPSRPLSASIHYGRTPGRPVKVKEATGV